MAGGSREAGSCVVPGTRKYHYQEAMGILQRRDTAFEIRAEDSPIFEVQVQVQVQFSREYLKAAQGGVMGGRALG